jgi:hypothetical protein
MGDAELAPLSPHIAIQQALARYCRGVDRLDGEMIKSAYWPEAQDDHLIFSGAVSDFVPWVLDLLAEATTTAHFLGQSVIALRGSQADVETYFHSWGREAIGGREILQFSIGRYLDRFEERSGEWRILNRKVVLDFSQATPLTDEAPANIFGGRHGPSDPSYPALTLLRATRT